MKDLAAAAAASIRCWAAKICTFDLGSWKLLIFADEAKINKA